jgi:hypothetical protein
MKPPIQLIYANKNIIPEKRRIKKYEAKNVRGNCYISVSWLIHKNIYYFSGV